MRFHIVAPSMRRLAVSANSNDLELLIISPATAPTGLNNLEPFNLSTELIAVHKDCYTALDLTRQGVPHRRKTAYPACSMTNVFQI